MVDISKHPLLKQCSEVCLAIEECGCSEKLTKAVIKCGELLDAIDETLANSTCNCNWESDAKISGHLTGYNEDAGILTLSNCTLSTCNNGTRFKARIRELNLQKER